MTEDVRDHGVSGVDGVWQVAAERREGRGMGKRPVGLSPHRPPPDPRPSSSGRNWAARSDGRTDGSDCNRSPALLSRKIRERRMDGWIMGRKATYSSQIVILFLVLH